MISAAELDLSVAELTVGSGKAFTLKVAATVGTGLTLGRGYVSDYLTS